jgi:hypothetical protein
MARQPIPTLAFAAIVVSSKLSIPYSSPRKNRGSRKRGGILATR